MRLYVAPISSFWDAGKRAMKKYPNLQKEFAEFVAKEFVLRIQDTINTQKLAHKWKPLSPLYLEFKKKKGLSLNIWEATSLLKNSIKVVQRGRVFYIEPDRKKRHSSGERVFDIAKRLEYGTKKIPARPLFRPVQQHMSKTMGRVAKKFLKSKGVVP